MNSCHILVVDDEPLVAASVSMLLTIDSHSVTVANSGAAALEQLEKNPFDVVLTDIAMPEMTGNELAAQIKKKHPKQPIGAVTAYAEKLRQVPVPWFDGILDKPVNLPDLRALVERLAPTVLGSTC
jgi:CheY-like chemotaxis protein